MRNEGSILPSRRLARGISEFNGTLVVKTYEKRLFMLCLNVKGRTYK